MAETRNWGLGTEDWYFYSTRAKRPTTANSTQTIYRNKYTAAVGFAQKSKLANTGIFFLGNHLSTFNAGNSGKKSNPTC